MIQTKHFTVLGIFFFSCMSLLTVLLFCEYRFFCTEVQKIIALQNQYHDYIIRVKKIVDNQQDNLSVMPQELAVQDSCWDGQQEFIVINRESEHLKQSALDYFKEQQLDELLTRLDVQDPPNNKASIITSKKRAQPTVSKPKKITPAHNSKAKNKKIINRRSDMHMQWPIKKSNFWLSSLFGPRKMKNGNWRVHRGIDMAALKGTPVKAAFGGVVSVAHYEPGYGNTVVIVHNKKYKSRYAHLSKIRVKKGQQVWQGKQIGDVGDTGFTRASGKDASHLHFEVYDHGKQINPLQVLPRI